MSFNKYPEYKDSDAEWLEKVPIGWSLRRVGFYFQERREKVSDKDYQPLSVTKNGIVPQLETAAKTDDGDNRKKVCKGDFVINSRSDRKGSSGLSELDGSVSLINTVLMPNQSIYGKFAHYLFRSAAFQEEYYRYGKGIVADLWSTNFSEMKNILLPIPEVVEQKKISTFLDHETFKIDSLIAEQEKLILLLKEKRQAVISQAVTKGLDLSVKMKDSGVEWLGEVPKHWQVKMLRRNVSINNKKSSSTGNQISLENIESWTGTFVETGVIYGEDGVAFAPNDVLFGKLRPYLAKVFLAKNHGVALGDLYVIRPSGEWYPDYLRYLICSYAFIEVVDSSTYGSKMPRANWDFIGSISVPIPSVGEQVAICNYLDKITVKFTPLIERGNALVEKLKERYSSLISAAVTGQIDVRNISTVEEAK